jgi:hypothetical protein
MLSPLPSASVHADRTQGRDRAGDLWQSACYTLRRSLDVERSFDVRHDTPPALSVASQTRDVGWVL